MLFINSILFFSDNSDSFSVKILNIFKNFSKHPVGKVSSLFLGVIGDYDLLKPKSPNSKNRTTCIIIATKKKYSKFNSIYINFSENRALSLKITRFINPIPNSIYSSIFYELKFFKKFKVVFEKSYAFF